MRKVSFNYLFIFLAIGCLLLFACQKGINWGGENTTSTVIPAGDYGWSSKLNDTTFKGCIDTAFYQSMGSLKTLFIQVNGITGVGIALGLISPTGNFGTGTYSSAASNGTIVVTDANNTNYTVSGTNTSFSFTVTAINDTIVTGTFTATLVDASSKILKITEGKIKALIGKANTCVESSIITNDTSAAFTLVKGLDSKCATVTVKGTYTSGSALNATNEAQVDINVTKTGKYTVATTTSNGIIFSAAGTFTATGNQTLTLKGSGNPIVAGTTTIPITVGSTNCNFTIVVR